MPEGSAEIGVILAGIGSLHLGAVDRPILV